MVQTCAEAVKEAVTEMGGTVSTREIINHIYRKHPDRPWKESTIRAHTIGCSVNHPSSHHYPSFPKFLFTVGRGRVRLYDPEKDGRPPGIIKGAAEEVGEEERKALEEATISLERDLENFILGNLSLIQEGLEPYKGEEGRQYQVKSGRIDILAQDKEGNFVVIELKAGTATDAVLTQILAYMADVSHEIAEGRKVRGIIVAYGFTDRLVSAASLLPNLKLLKYKVKFEFEEVAK
jgi:hypothetical protein